MFDSKKILRGLLASVNKLNKSFASVTKCLFLLLFKLQLTESKL